MNESLYLQVHLQSTSLYMLTEAEKFVRSDILVCGYTIHKVEAETGKMEE